MYLGHLCAICQQFSLKLSWRKSGAVINDLWWSVMLPAQAYGWNSGVCCCVLQRNNAITTPKFAICTLMAVKGLIENSGCEYANI